MKETRITYAGEFVQIPETTVRGPVEDTTRYVGGGVSQWKPVITTSEPGLERAGHDEPPGSEGFVRRHPIRFKAEPVTDELGGGSHD